MKKGKTMRLVVKFSDSNFCNIAATMITQDANFVYAFNGDHLVGIFSIGAFEALYLSEKV